MKITVPIDAIPQERPRVYNRVAVDPPKSKNFKLQLAAIVKSLRPSSVLLTGKIKLDIQIFRNKKSVTSRRFGDIDNLTKSVMDALTGVLWLDDSQITELHVTKNIADTPSIILELEEC